MEGRHVHNHPDDHGEACLLLHVNGETEHSLLRLALEARRNVLRGCGEVDFQRLRDSIRVARMHTHSLAASLFMLPVTRKVPSIVAFSWNDDPHGGELTTSGMAIAALEIAERLEKEKV